MQNQTKTFVIQQLIVISILVLANLYYYHRLDTVFNDSQTVKYRGAIETLKSQIDVDNTEHFQSFIHKSTTYKPITSLKKTNPFSMVKECFEQQANTTQVNTIQTDQGENIQTDINQPNTVNCQEVIELYPQKDKSFNVTGTKLGDFQEMFNNVQKLTLVCKQQIPIGSIIPFAYYYEKDDSGQYKLLLDDKTQSTLPTQILLRKTDNLVLVPLLGGTLTKSMVSQVLGSECVFIKAMFQKTDKMVLPNTDKKVLKQTTDNTLMNVDNSSESGLSKIVQKIKKSAMFFHDVQQSDKWTLAKDGMYYTSPPPNRTIQVKRGGVSAKNSSYMQDQARDERNTTIHNGEQQLKGNIEINIEDPYTQVMFCMVIGYM